MITRQIPIIAIDGTSSSGKGSIAYMIAKHFGFNYLNSGALYRLVAYEALSSGVELDDMEMLINIAKNLDVVFEGKKVIVNGDDVWPVIGTQAYGNPASIVSRIPEVRYALFERQREMIQEPGLVAEGRDMCTNVFQDAQVKIYLDAAPEERARRRYHDEETIHSGKMLEQIYEEILERDERDKNKEILPPSGCEDGRHDEHEQGTDARSLHLLVRGEGNIEIKSNSHWTFIKTNRVKEERFCFRTREATKTL